MAGVLAAERRSGFCHHLLDVGVPDSGSDRDPAELAHDLGHGLRADEVVHDGAVGVGDAVGQPSEDRGGDDGGGERAGERLSLLVDEEDTVGVPVEREPDVGVLLHDGLLEVSEVLGLDRVGRVVRERPVELAEEDGQLDGEAVEHGGDDEAAEPVGRVGDDPLAAERFDVDEGAHVGDERAEEVPVLDSAAAGSGRELPGGDGRLDVGEAGLDADGRGAGPAELDAVVLGRVVAGGEHGSGGVEGPGREVDEVGGGEAEVDDVDAGSGHPVGERGDERLGRGPGVAADEDSRGSGEGGERAADEPGDGLVELVGVDPPDVVGLEDRVERRRWDGHAGVNLLAASDGFGGRATPARRGRRGRAG